MGNEKVAYTGSAEMTDKESVFVIDESTGFLINAVARLFAKSLHRRLMEHGVPIGQWPFLMFLWEQDELTQTALSKKIGVDNATTVRTIDRMEKAGLVERVRSSKDRRQIKIVLTEKAQDLKKTLQPLAVEVNTLATEGLTQEQKFSVNQLLKHMIMKLANDDQTKVESFDKHVNGLLD